jgi:hypothetical protein
MSKLKTIVKQLSLDDYKEIYNQLSDSGAEKSAQLIMSLREKQISDAKIMEELDVNTNAFYTLRSRLNQKIEEFLLQQMENPRTDLLKKVANISELIFTRKKAIAIATLKKLEKELLDFDLSNELTIVYKSLKKLHINSPDSFSYSQLYNRHVAYMLALDKSEDLMSEYFKKYGGFLLSGSEVERLELTMLFRELTNISKLYQSHRLYVYQSCVGIFHRLFVDDNEQEHEEAIEDILKKIESIFDQYYTDGIYFNLKLVIEFLKLEYYTHIRVHRKADPYFEDIHENLQLLLNNYHLYTFPARHLITKIERAIRSGTEKELYLENKALFEDYESDLDDVPKNVIYTSYRASSCYYIGKYEEASHLYNSLLNEVNLKRYPQAHIEIKLAQALMYCLVDDRDLFNQNINSLQRQLRMMEENSQYHATMFIKLMKAAMGDDKPGKLGRLRDYVIKIKGIEIRHFSPISMIKLDDSLADLLFSVKRSGVLI